MPDRDSVHEQLTDLFRDVLDDDTIVIEDATTAQDIDGWDSLTHIQLILATQRHFRIKFTASEIGGLKNVGQMIDLITARAG